MSELEDRRGIGSVDIAMSVLRVFADSTGAMSLKEISDRTGLATSKLHRYLASLVAQGMVSQKERSGRYDLGPLAAELGLAALGRSDFVNKTAAALPDLVDRVGCTAMLSVWGSNGGTIVRWERAHNHIVTTLGLGTVMPLLESATGRIFLAYLPESLTLQALAPQNLSRAQALRKEIRELGYAAVGGDFIPGLYALAAPVRNWQGDAEAAVTLISLSPDLIDPKGDILRDLLATCRDLSLPRKG
ncbi:IclR family transcriptional regulator [Rhodospirillaceae bacterium KN72]|uniref:IclR family transcriptional regulator n=1 Tax=Pacificispira spongiicola TaxID=2729598 RepID=A0A7Y0DZH9_9PROT|nr:IclR family transcriptional regulator [Pacificispira spongiicola]NMM44472.1 IclR family transcriptional regulator [Pacificispira spongiicola]